MGEVKKFSWLERCKAFEEKWLRRWEEGKVFEADPKLGKRKVFVTFPFPYMNGPLHVGHAYTATRVDVYARFKRMQGFNVLFPWAWHWTGETIAGAAERLKLGDQAMVREFRDIDKVPDEELRKFTDPAYMAHYYTKSNREAVRRVGYSVDWRREFHTTSLEPTFSRFIEWQYRKLLEEGYVAKGTHPVVWCPKCESPTGDADRLEGEGVRPEDYILIKFKLKDSYLPAATFRPETIYGVTNLWINPEARYVEALVDGERWVISEAAVKKLKEQLRDVKVFRSFIGAEVVGMKCINLIDGRPLLILPGWFVNPNNASGVVYSVPAHAPYDFIALRDLLEKPWELNRYGVSVDDVKEIKPISMIKVEGFGEYPAIEIVERLGVKDQYDRRCEEATRIIYRKEFHEGVLKDVCGPYSGSLVYEVKEKLIKEFKKIGLADFMYDLPQQVVCRCTTPCYVKVLADQWFLAYSKKDWKDRAKEAVAKAKVYPEPVKLDLSNKIDWYHDWACVRRTGLGTPLPWSPGWIVETLSDSTIYPAFYTIMKYIRMHGVEPRQLTDEVFDYIFLGKGSLKEASTHSGLDESIVSAMRNEFLYWYPVDLRNTGKDLVPNHLTFYFFHHAAIFPPELWPVMVSVNGFVTIEGMKISKSKGNVVTMRSAVELYGADATRCTLLLGGEDLDDPDWHERGVIDVSRSLEGFYNLISQVYEMPREGLDKSRLDSWLISTLQKRILEVTISLETLKTRTALQQALFSIWNDLRWYLRRADKPNKETVMEFVESWVRLMAPFAPFTCEELWSLIGGKGLVSLAEWPKYEENKIDLEAELTERFIAKTLEDTQEIIRVIGVKPRLICFYAAPRWKLAAYRRVLREAREGVLDVKVLTKGLVKDPEVKARAEDIAKFVRDMLKVFKTLPKEDVELRSKIVLEDLEVLKDGLSFFERELGVEVKVYDAEDPGRYDPRGKAPTATPYRPAIYIEGAS